MKTIISTLEVVLCGLGVSFLTVGSYDHSLTYLVVGVVMVAAPLTYYMTRGRK